MLIRGPKKKFWMPSAAVYGAPSGGGPPVAWTPLVLGSALVAWWDAQDSAHITQSGGTVSSWVDKISGINETNSNVPNQPGYSATARNGTPGLTFSGNQVLFAPTTGLPMGPSPITVAVAGFSTSAAYAYSLGNNGANQQIGINTDSGIVSLYTGNGSVLYRAAETWSSNDRFVILGIASDEATASWNVDGNAAEPFTISPPVAITTQTSFGTGGSLIGCFVNGTVAFFTGTIQQIWIFNRLLTASESAKLAGFESWYDGKAGSNLPIGSPYKSRAPLVSDP